MELAALKTTANLLERVDRRTVSGRCCSMWESRLVYDSITHHPNKTSPLGDTACVLHLPLEKAQQEHVKSTEPNTEPLST